MRLIDVDDLGVGRCSKDVLPAAYCAGWNGLLGLIEKAPTADAALVVRCEDCLYWVSGKNECESWEWCKMLNTDMPPNGFCYLGERKDEAQNER